MHPIVFYLPSASVPSPGYLRIPPHRQVYKAPSSKQQKQKAQEKIKLYLGGKAQEQIKLHLGSQTQEKRQLPLANRPSKGVPYASCPQPIPCISRHSLLNSHLFHIRDSSGKPISSNSSLLLPGGPCCHCLFLPLL